LHSQEKSLIQISQRIVPVLPEKQVILRGIVKILGIEGGQRPWEKGRVVLLQFVNGKAVYTSPFVLAALQGTQAWKKFRLITSILPATTDIRLIMQLNNCAGELQVRELSLHRIEENQLYNSIRWVVIGTWSVFILGFFIPGIVVREEKRWSVLVVLVIGTIILGTTVPASVKMRRSTKYCRKRKTMRKK
jgi:hypothetical protein